METHSHEMQQINFELSREVKERWWQLPRTWREHGHYKNPGACPVPRRNHLLGAWAGAGLDLAASLPMSAQTGSQPARALGAAGIVGACGLKLASLGAVEVIEAALKNKPPGAKRSLAVLYNVPAAAPAPVGEPPVLTLGPNVPPFSSAVPENVFAFFVTPADAPTPLTMEPAGEAILFDTGSTTIDGATQEALRKLGAALSRMEQDDPRVRVLVTGGADPRGSQDANYKLSEQRINAVVAALTRVGVQVHEKTPSGDSLAPKTGLKPEDMARLREVRIFIQRPAKDAGGN